MRVLLMTLAALLVLGCQTTPPDYRALTERLDAGGTVEPADLRKAFLAAEDLPARMARLSDLEAQALSVVEDEPLKLGSIGSAIIDTYMGSLTGHFVLARFYEHVGSDAEAATHRAWVERMRNDMETEGDGSQERPLPAVTPLEARVYAMSYGWSPVGSIYQSSDETPFSLVIQVRPETGRLKNLNFDLTGMYLSMREQFAGMAQAHAGNSAGAGGEDEGEGDSYDPEITPFTVIGFLAKQNDTAAQAAVGAFLASPPQQRLEDAVNWLRASSRTGNVLANSLLARIFWEQARVAENDEEREQALELVMENYLHAIALGSADAMYALGVLYLNGHYGQENKISGIPLLKQASELEHSDATMFLAHLSYAGEVIDKDLTAAREYYVQASELGNPFARRSYARFLLDRDAGQAADPRAVAWLEELAEEGEAESMLLLGNLHARGLQDDDARPSIRRAVKWFKQAVKTSPTDPNIVNEVAWTLTVSEDQDLRRARYARRIMDRMMEANAEARARPEYMDTWAATHAANGAFTQAVSLQQQAVDLAVAAGYSDMVGILEEHLEAFRAGRTISEDVP